MKTDIFWTSNRKYEQITFQLLQSDFFFFFLNAGNWLKMVLSSDNSSWHQKECIKTKGHKGGVHEHLSEI